MVPFAICFATEVVHRPAVVSPAVAGFFFGGGVRADAHAAGKGKGAPYPPGGRRTQDISAGAVPGI